MKTRGIQITTTKFLHNVQCEGMIGRQIVYVKNMLEMTLDTDKGSFIITEKDLLNLIERRNGKCL